MKLEDLPEFDDLDVEFSKNCETIYEIMVSNFNKRIKLINILGKDLYEFVKENFEGTQWKITQYIEVDPAFPKKIRDENLSSEFGSDIYVESYLKINRKNKKDGFSISFYFYLKDFNWEAGQFYGNEKGDEFFKFPFYQNLKNKIDKEADDKLKISIFFPDTDNEHEDWKDWKFINLSIESEIVDKREVILHYHNLFKKMVLTPMIKHLNK